MTSNMTNSIKTFYVVLLLLLSVLNAGNIFSQTVPAEKELQFARKLYDDTLYSLAAQQFERFVKEHPNHEQADAALFFGGEAYIKLDDFKHAYKLFMELELAYPRSAWLVKARIKMAECQERLKNYANAAVLYRRVYVLSPESDLAPQALLNSGKSYTLANREQDAIKTYFDLVQSYPNSSQRFLADLAIINSRFSEGRYQDALQYINAIFKKFGDNLENPKFYALKANIFIKLGQLEKAEGICADLIKRFSAQTEADFARIQLAQIYQKQGKFDAALNTYNQVVNATKSDSIKASVFEQEGDLLFKLRRYQEALSAYEKGRRLNVKTEPDFLDFKIAETERNLGKFKRAAESYERVLNTKNEALEDSPQLIQKSYKGLVASYAGAEKFTEALHVIKNYRRKFSVEKQNDWFRFKEAKIIEQNVHDYSRATRVYAAFMEEFPFSPRVDEAQRRLALCYEKLQEFPSALKEYQNYLTRFTAGDDVAWVQERIRTIRDVVFVDKAGNLNAVATVLLTMSSQAKPLDSIKLAKAFYEIKAFKAAVEQLKNSLTKKGKSDKKWSDGFYWLGMAYYQLARRQDLFGLVKKSETLFDSAAVSLNYFVKNSADSVLLENAGVSLAQIALKQRTEDRKTLLDSLVRSFERTFPNSKFLSELKIQQGDLYLNEVEADTADIHKAFRFFGDVLKTKQSEDILEKATFLRAKASVHINPDSTTLQLLNEFMQRFAESQYLPVASLLKADLEASLGNETEAIALLEKVLEKYYYSGAALKAVLQLGELYQKKGKYNSALDSYRSFLKLEKEYGVDDKKGTHASLVLTEAHLYDQLGDDENALHYYFTFLHENPFSRETVQAKLAIAAIARRQKNLAVAKNYYNSIVASEADESDREIALFSLGEIYFDQHLYKDARPYFLEAAKLAHEASSEKPALSYAVRCLYKQKFFKQAEIEAKAFFKKYKDSKADRGQFLLDKANAYKSDKNFDLAEKAFKKLKSDFKQTDLGAKGEFGLGSVYLITNHVEDALKILTDIPAKYPDSDVTPLTYYNLGDFYYKSQQVENAIHAFKQSVNHKKAGDYKPKGMLYLIQCYADAGMWDKAVALTREFLDEYPESKQAFRKQVDIAVYLMKLKEYDRSVAKLKELLPFADQENEAEIQFYIGQCYKEKGDFAQAATEFLKVNYLTRPTKLPWHVTALFEAGRSLIRMGDVDQAQKIFQTIVKTQGAESNFGRFALQKLQELDLKSSSGNSTPDSTSQSSN